MKKGSLLMGILGIGFSMALLYGTVYVASKGWKNGQKPS